MINLNEILKELRVDWDTVVSDSFNPLQISFLLNKGIILSSDFRDMYHKLEAAMEIIIAENYKGFCDSVFSYNFFNKHNKFLLDNLNSILEIVKFDEFNLNIKNIKNQNSESEYFKSKYLICKSLVEIKLSFEEFQNTVDILKKCFLIVRCLDLIDNKEFVKIKGVFEYRKLIYQEYLDLTEKININIFNFIFSNDINNSFKCLLTLGSLYELENFIKFNFRNFLFNEIENLITEMYKLKIDLEELCKKIMKKINMVIKNYECIIELTLNNFKLNKTNEDFFGNQNENYLYVTKLEYILEMIKEELNKFIGRYSVSTEYDNNFSVENIIDNIDYNQIYPVNFNIFKNKINKIKIKEKIIDNNKNQYTLISTPRIEVTTFLLKYTQNPNLRIFLNQKVETEYTKFKLEKNKKKIDYILDSEISIDKINKRLSFQNDIFKIIKNKETKSSNNNFNNDSNHVSNYDKQILKYLDKKIRKVFEKLFLEIFKSEIILSVMNIENGNLIFQKNLIKKYINKNDLLLKKQKYCLAIYSLNTLKDFESILSTKECTEIYGKYLDAFKKQINLEFFYYFDLFYREGNFSSNFYLKKIISIFEFFFNETKNSLLFDGLYENLIFYCKNNVSVFKVKSKKDLECFIDQLKIFDEIMSEVEFYSTLKSLYDFYDEVLQDKCEDFNGKILQAKIKNTQ